MARKGKKYHYIYKITCLKNNRYYIGMHSTDNLEDGYMGGGKRIKNSVKKHGKDAHIKEILEFFENRELLRQREIELVNEELLKDPMCINLQQGGGGGFPIDPQSIINIREGASKNLKNRWNDTEYRKKICIVLKENNRLAHINGKCNYDNFKGKKHTDESKDKIGRSNSIAQLGNKNSQFGTCWITNGTENKKIKKIDNIPDGWHLGRILKN